MFKDSLYKITSQDHHDGVIDAVLEINKEDKIFTGHFPGHPVLPGASMLQIIKEVLEDTLKASFRLKKADQIKFLAISDPSVNNLLKLKLAYSITDDINLDVIANFSQSDICCKFKGSFVRLKS
ncbi:MAG: FabA-like domain protein [Mucilaginibacter sp.]|nr:FabA-like domain protein [Mucilaginibacter sp.]MDB5139409.1 FabA-like domain protein [Mucilaginibacter sp.]